MWNKITGDIYHAPTIRFLRELAKVLDFTKQINLHSYRWCNGEIVSCSMDNYALMQPETNLALSVG